MEVYIDFKGRNVCKYNLITNTNRIIEVFHAEEVKLPGNKVGGVVSANKCAFDIAFFMVSESLIAAKENKQTWIWE